MSDTSTQVDDGTQTDDGDSNLKLLREKAKRTDTAEAENQALQRKVAILESGLDVESPLGELFLKSYDGDLTPEALKEEAAKYGVPMKGQAPAGATGEETGGGTGGEGGGEGGTTEPTGTTERRTLADGAPADTGEEKDPRQTAREHFDRRIAEGAPQEVAAGEHVNMLAQAAMAGDKRVVFDERAHREEGIRRAMGG